MNKTFVYFVLLFVIMLNTACTQTQKPMPSTSADTNLPKQEPSFSPREILAKQPDFVAEEFSSSFERLHGHSFVTKIAKKGVYYRREGPIMVFFDKAGEPTLSYWRPAKIFVNDPPAKQPLAWYDNASNAEIFAQTEGVKFEVVGKEKVEGHECLKIKASAESEAQAEEKDKTKVFLYAATDLRNLVIATELFLPDRKTRYVLKSISFEVPDDLFKVLARRPKQTSNNRINPTRPSRSFIHVGMSGGLCVALDAFLDMKESNESEVEISHPDCRPDNGCFHLVRT